MARTHKHLWPKVVSLGNLMQAANLAMRGCRRLAPVAGCFSEWELECVNFAEELENGTYRPGAYRYFNQTTTRPRTRTTTWGSESPGPRPAPRKRGASVRSETARSAGVFKSSCGRAVSGTSLVSKAD